MDSTFQLLKDRLRKVYCLRETSELLAWDQETMMPSASGEARADQISVVTELGHQILTSLETGELLQKAKAEVSDTTSFDYLMLRKAQWEYDRASKVPQKLVADLAQASAIAREAWVKAREAKDFSVFADKLEAVIDLTGQSAQYYGYTENIYDALLDAFEPGLKTSSVTQVFKELREGLVELVKKIASCNQVDTSVIEQSYPVNLQRLFTKDIMTDMGYDWTRGRTDDVIHPFCCSFSTRDVRVTNAFRENEITKALFGAMHETGHAIYEQATPIEWIHSPLEGGASMAFHESQSRLWENIIGRSDCFWQDRYPKMCRIFPEQTARYSQKDFYKAINRVEPSLIRIEADEVTYSLHIMLRFELEKAIFEGKLKLKDVPQAWNSAMKDYLGVVPQNDLEGCLQDVHWALGSFGYFPTYALGNLISAQVWQKLLSCQPDAQKAIAQGNLDVPRKWLTDNIYSLAAAYLPDELIVKVTGRPLEAKPFLDYLNKKYAEVYGF